MNTASPPPGDESEAFWRAYLTEGDPAERRLRRVLQRIPAGPRCAACAAPFGGIGRQVIRLMGKRPSTQNPNLCNSCFDFMISHRGGAEIDCTLLFADIRGSTALAERIPSGEFRALLDRFYRAATEAIFSNDGSVDKFVGDEVMAMFIPLVTHDHHPAQAVAAARAILRATGHDEPGGPWVPVGVGIHTGPAWVGVVGDESHVELTAVGDTVNTAARLASAAQGGEILVSSATAELAHLDPDLRRSMIELKGKQEPFEVVHLGGEPRATPTVA